MAKQITDLMKLSRDALHNPSVNFNNKTLDDGLREAIIESVGGEWNRYAFMDNKGKFFSVIAEALTLPMNETLEGLFADNVKVDQIALDGTKVITIDEDKLFRVATIASGNNDIRRQRIYNRKVVVETEKLGIKIYEDFDRFITGKINWSQLIERVRKSFAVKVSEKIYEAILTGYDALNVDAKYSKTGSFAEDKMDELISRVEAKTGLRVGLYGTKKALGKITKGLTTAIGQLSDSKKDEYFNLGYFRNYKGGTPMFEIPTLLKQGTDEFLFEDDYIFVLPVGMDVVNVVYKGDAIVDEVTSPIARNDQQIEFLFEQAVGVAVLIARYYGVYKLA